MTLSTPAALLFSEDFNGLSLWNGKSGTWSTSFDWQGTPNGSTLPGEQEWYIDSNYLPTQNVDPWAANDGILTITASKADATTLASTSGHDIVSGQLNTRHSFHQTYGYFEIRADMTDTKGGWPAFWLVNSDGTNQYELDVVEMIGNNTTNLVTTLHDNSLGQTSATGKIINSTNSTVSDMSAGFHTYGVDWQTDYISWYFDGKLVHQVATPAEMNKDMFMILNLAVGGAMPGNIDTSTFGGAQMQVDYVRVYDKIPAGAVQTASLATAVSSGTEVIYGTAADDLNLAGGIASNEIYGGAGNDIINGGAGDDRWLSGDADNDVVYGGDGNDVASGGDGADTLFGNLGDDKIYGGIGDDVISGGDGNDSWLAGEAGNDQIRGGGGNDMIAGGDGNDKVWGEAGNDTISADLGDDWIHGSAGDDAITGGDGIDTLWGDSGNDKLSGDAGADYVYGGDGTDFVSGGDGNDQLRGEAGNDQVIGGVGDDYADGGIGDDSWVSGGEGNDTVLGGAGNDVVSGDAGNDRLDGGVGNDTLWGGTGNDTLLAGGGNDVLSGGADSDKFVFVATKLGSSVINDFQHGIDKIDITGAGLSFDALMKSATDNGQGIVLHLGPSTTVQLPWQHASNLSASDFILH